MIIEATDIINAFSIFITFLLGIVSTIISVRNSKKLKDMENYKHSLKMKELRIDTQYKNNQLVMEEVHMLITNIKNLSCTSDCYLFRSEKEMENVFIEVKNEARNSLIWVKKRINILSVYMDKDIYNNIIDLFKSVREILDTIEFMNYNDFLNDIIGEKIQNVEEQGRAIIKMIQLDNEKIITQ